MAQFFRKLKRVLFNYDPAFCDMYEDPHAKAAAEEYLGHIQRHLREQFGEQRLTILDAGCQTGRLLIPLAKEGHRLIGIDASHFSLRRARQHAARASVSVELHEGDLANLRRWIAPRSLDVVLCLEVLYLCQNYRELLRLLVESVKPGGLLCVSHRPTHYYVAVALMRRKPADALAVLQQSEGVSPEGAYHNWQDQGQLMELYRTLGLKWLACYAIDHVTVSLHPEELAAPALRAILSSESRSTGTVRVPAYLLAIVQQPARNLS